MAQVPITAPGGASGASSSKALAGVPKDLVRAARRQRAARLDRARRERWRFRARRLRRAVLAIAAIYLATLVAALALGGIPFMAGVLSVLLGMAVFVLLSIYPSTPRLHAADLNGATLTELAGATEIWLEGKRPALPNAAVDAIDLIGVRLEQIGPQLAAIEAQGPGAIAAARPATGEVRKLLTEHLPALVDSYTRIPAALRTTPGAGGTSPSRQLVDGLCVIAHEIDAMSLNLSQGDLDALATRGRFLETRYVDARPGGEA